MSKTENNDQTQMRSCHFYEDRTTARAKLTRKSHCSFLETNSLFKNV